MWGEARYFSIHVAASLGNNHAVNQHLIYGTNPNSRDKSGFTPLHHAAANNQIIVVEMLIAAGANVNSINPIDGNQGLTPLHEACYAGQYDTIEILLKNGAYINIKTVTGLTPLNLAENYAEKVAESGYSVEAKKIIRLLKNRGTSSLHHNRIALLPEGYVNEKKHFPFFTKKLIPFITYHRWQDILCFSSFLLFGAMIGAAQFLSSEHGNYRLSKSICAGIAACLIITFLYLFLMIIVGWFLHFINYISQYL